ncbi:restriction endonuclease subunit S [Bacteroides thetaiotaomicron]|jgi:type I restriction enzyme S subunit|uniref:restriction endonuclease subunit S n=1 Tax=Bacteroides thetaiotaomicron TaxID=818 RepID=UPI00135D2D2E|nr:restriction endonuclease subunit S [Bacteroides thetaiotaomicron]KAB4518445.1 restriction endonuclease subunit S [Bacteroides thetaiotaomicron]MBV3727056.1 restriction endonuclease subunit S [Bacteroides thetaiotaomicron]MBV4235342.1 restriction endonuclease subunit S [Bacteroides thetaiotaomicron]MCB7310914.1 restriction endonuclease subunit S [Bacteroides thetaiotaomicron]MCE8711941.1 restriction endonuclease subunit S [Bacteroides thetaiotaomicron]
MPHYENVPFEIPNSWVWTTIEEICSKIGSGSTPRGSNYSANGIPFFRSQNVYNDRLVYDDIKYISEEVHQKMKGTEVLANDLLLNITGGSLGRCAVVPADFNCGNVSQHVCIMRSVLVEPEYFHALVLSSYFAKSMKITGSGREGLPKYSLEQMAFPLPPLSEQQRIVMEIEKLFALIDQIEHSKVNLQTIIKQTKSKILDLAIHGKLVPQDPNDEPAIELLKRINPDFTPCDNGHSGKLPYKIPKTWAWCSHNSILDISGGSQPAKSYFETIPKPNYIRLYQIRDYGESPVPVYIPINLASKQTEKGDILLARYGGSLGKVFHAKQGAYNVAMVKVIFKFENLIYKEYAYYYYLSDLYQGKLKEISRTAQTGFNITDFNDMYFPLPPINEQQRIVQKIEELFSSLDNIQKSLEV